MLDKGLFNVGKKLFQLSEKSDVKYYAIVLSNVWQGCCPTSEHTNHVLAAMRMDCFYDGNGREPGGRMVVEYRESA